jgi:hypothetical protein
LVSWVALGYTVDVYVLRARYSLGACIRSRQANQVALCLFGMVSVSVGSFLSPLCSFSSSVRIIVDVVLCCRWFEGGCIALAFV